MSRSPQQFVLAITNALEVSVLELVKQGVFYETD